MDAQRRDLLAMSGLTLIGTISIPVHQASASKRSNNTGDSLDTVGSLSVSAKAIDAIGSAGYPSLIERMHTAEQIDVTSIEGTTGIRSDGTTTGLFTATGSFDPVAVRSALRAEGIESTVVPDASDESGHERMLLSTYPLAIEVKSSTMIIARDRSAEEAVSLLVDNPTSAATIASPDTEFDQRLSGALVGTVSLGSIGRSRLIDRLTRISEPVATVIETAQSIGIEVSIDDNTATAEYGAIVDPTAISVSSVRASIESLCSDSAVEFTSVELSEQILWTTLSIPVTAAVETHSKLTDSVGTEKS